MIFDEEGLLSLMFHCTQSEVYTEHVILNSLLREGLQQARNRSS